MRSALQSKSATSSVERTKWILRFMCGYRQPAAELRFASFSQIRTDFKSSWRPTVSEMAPFDCKQWLLVSAQLFRRIVSNIPLFSVIFEIPWTFEKGKSQTHTTALCASAADWQPSPTQARHLWSIYLSKYHRLTATEEYILCSFVSISDFSNSRLAIGIAANLIIPIGFLSPSSKWRILCKSISHSFGIVRKRHFGHFVLPSYLSCP